MEFNIVNTHNYNTIMNLCSDTMKRNRMIGVIGYPGAGKTTALTNFSLLNDSAYYVVVKPSMTAKHFYGAVLESLGFPDQIDGLGVFDLIRKVCFILNSDDTKKLLIIDEAGKFSRKMLEYLHELRDETDETTGIILSGPDYFQENILKWVNKNFNGMPEIARRINSWSYLQLPKLEEIKSICEENGILDPEVANELFSSCENFSKVKDRITDYNDAIKNGTIDDFSWSMD